MFTSLRLKNFKSWTDTGAIPLAPITAFFGTNSSGKTSLLQSLLLMRQTVESTDRNRVLEMGGAGTLIELGTYRDLATRHDTGIPLGISVTWDSNTSVSVFDEIKRAQKKKSLVLESSSFMFETKLTLARTSDPVDCIRYGLRAGAEGSISSTMIDITRREDGKGYDLSSESYDFKRTVGRAWPLRTPAKFYGIPDQARLYYQNANFLADLELALEEQLLRIRYLGPLRHDPQRQYIFTGGGPSDVGRRGELAVDALVHSQTIGKRVNRGLTSAKKRKAIISVEMLVASWLKELGLIDSFQVRAVDDRRTLYRVEVRRSPDSSDVLLTDVGFGVSQVLPVLVLLAYAEPGDTVILEQPEIHLHPSVQSGLADVILETALARGVQVIVESHSEHLVSRLQRRIAEGEVGDGLHVTPADIALYFCDQAGGESEIEKLMVNDLGEIVNWPRDFFGDPMSDAVARVRAAAAHA